MKKMFHFIKKQYAMQTPRKKHPLTIYPPHKCGTGEINAATDGRHAEVFGTHLIVIGDKEQEQGHCAQGQ
jgi:hypothetical protein